MRSLRLPAGDCCGYDQQSGGPACPGGSDDRTQRRPVPRAEAASFSCGAVCRVRRARGGRPAAPHEDRGRAMKLREFLLGGNRRARLFVLLALALLAMLTVGIVIGRTNGGGGSGPASQVLGAEVTETAEASATAIEAAETVATSSTSAEPGELGERSATAAARPAVSGTPAVDADVPTPDIDAPPASDRDAPAAPSDADAPPAAAAAAGAAPAPLPTPTAVQPQAVAPGGSGCVTNCGEPRFFCDAGGWAFCDDYRDIFCPVKCAFPAGGRRISVDALSTSRVDYGTSGYTQAGMNFFGNDQEHFHSIVDDESFGVAIMRFQQPFDFAGRTGRIHFDVDLKTSNRRYIRMTLSPELTKRGVDDRGGELYPKRALDLWFKNGGIIAMTYSPNGPQNINDLADAENTSEPYIGVDNVRDHVEVYVSRSRIRVVVNGTQAMDQGIADLGFDQAYLYLQQASYNPCKDGECDPKQQTFHWDNVAFDGPVLANNGLTPAGYRDIVFNVYGAAACSVKGIAADNAGAVLGYAWSTWRARLPDDGSPVGPGDVACSGDAGNFGQWDGVPHGFEVVRPG